MTASTANWQRWVRRTVLRDFSRHKDSRSLDHYSKPRATRGALVRAFRGPSLVPAVQKAEEAEANTADNSAE